MQQFLQRLFQPTSLLYISLDYYVITSIRHYVQPVFTGQFQTKKFNPVPWVPIQFIFVFKMLRFNRSFTLQSTCKLSYANKISVCWRAQVQIPCVYKELGAGIVFLGGGGGVFQLRYKGKFPQKF